MDQLFADFVATGGDVYISSARPPLCVDLDEEMVDSMSGFASFLQARMDKVNCEMSSSIGQEPPLKNTLSGKTTTSVLNKKQKVTAATMLERDLIRVAMAYERKYDLIALQKEELDDYFIAKYISLLNETSIEFGSKQ